jgi:hypothetical protein
MSNTINFNANNQQNQVGDNNNNSQTMNNAANDGIDLEAFLKALEATIKEVEPEQVEAVPEQPEVLYGDVRNTAYDAEGKEEYDVEHTQTLLGRFQDFVSKAGPKLTKALVAFGTEAATAYIGENPIARGVIAAIQSLQDSE